VVAEISCSSQSKGMNSTFVFLVGDPAYYLRFRFIISINWNIKNIQDIPDEFVMACELILNTLQGISGVITL
jgi:predicted N-acetyltransferase YhbS